jgi:signal transduction histidine kinase
VLPPLEPGLKTACFRVAQEALTNVDRHARADHVWIDLHVLDGALELSVRDDGTGFDVAAARDRAIHGASVGLLGMQERVALMGGEYEIVRVPAGGTEVRARFPLTTGGPS